MMFQHPKVLEHGGASQVDRPSPTLPADVLSPQLEALDELLVAVVICALEVIEQTSALADDAHQAASRVMILLVELEVLGELGEPLRQQGYLDLGRSRICLALLVALDDGLLGLTGNQFLSLSHIRSSAAPSEPIY